MIIERLITKKKQIHRVFILGLSAHISFSFLFFSLSYSLLTFLRYISFKKWKTTRARVLLAVSCQKKNAHLPITSSMYDTTEDTYVNLWYALLLA